MDCKTDIKKKLVICSPYIKRDAVEKLVNDFLIDKNSEDVHVLIRGTLSDFLSGSSDIDALTILMKYLQPQNIRRLTNLHMKAYFFDMKYLLITSGNWTVSGMFTYSNTSNVEGGIATDEVDVISKFSEYYNQIVKFSESIDAFYDELVENYVNKIKKKKSILLHRASTDDELIHRYIFKNDYDNKIVQDGNIYRLSSEDIPQIDKFYVGAYLVPKILIEYGNGELNKSQIGVLLGNVQKKMRQIQNMV